MLYGSCGDHLVCSLNRSNAMYALGIGVLDDSNLKLSECFLQFRIQIKQRSAKAAPQTIFCFS